jgi:ADP-ribosylglycohydrolase
MNNREAITGCLLGTALGDSVALPFEGLAPNRCRFSGKQSLIFGQGMVSDDTEHTVMLAYSIIEHSDDIPALCQAFATRDQATHKPSHLFTQTLQVGDEIAQLSVRELAN